MGRRPAKTPKEKLQASLEDFLGWLCVEWGFCGTDIEPVGLERDDWTADEFAGEVLRAEGIGNLETEYRKQIREEFIRRFGSTFGVKDFAED